MPLRRIAFLVWLGLAAALSPALAEQDRQSDPALTIAVLDERRLFSESRFGQRVLRETQAAIDVLVAENKQIEATLEREESDLAARRDGMDPQAFRELADAFDQRVTEQRRERAEREQAISLRIQEEERRFQGVATSILAAFAEESGLMTIMSSQTLIYHRPEIDITERLIERINATLGDGVN